MLPLCSLLLPSPVTLIRSPLGRLPLRSADKQIIAVSVNNLTSGHLLDELIDIISWQKDCFEKWAPPIFSFFDVGFS